MGLFGSKGIQTFKVKTKNVENNTSSRVNATQNENFYKSFLKAYYVYSNHIETESHIFHILLKALFSLILQRWQLLSFLDTLSPVWSQTLQNPTI